MLLLDQETITIDSARTITVVSNRDNIKGKSHRFLRTRGLENIEIIKKRFFLNLLMKFHFRQKTPLV